jgi:hypothetical protein
MCVFPTAALHLCFQPGYGGRTGQHGWGWQAPGRQAILLLPLPLTPPPPRPATFWFIAVCGKLRQQGDKVWLRPDP